LEVKAMNKYYDITNQDANITLDYEGKSIEINIIDGWEITQKAINKNTIIETLNCLCWYLIPLVICIWLLIKLI
jgi:hypothetical protein